MPDRRATREGIDRITCKPRLRPRLTTSRYEESIPAMPLPRETTLLIQLLSYNARHFSFTARVLQTRGNGETLLHRIDAYSDGSRLILQTDPPAKEVVFDRSKNLVEIASIDGVTTEHSFHPPNFPPYFIMLQPSIMPYWGGPESQAQPLDLKSSGSNLEVTFGVPHDSGPPIPYMRVAFDLNSFHGTQMTIRDEKFQTLSFERNLHQGS